MMKLDRTDTPASVEHVTVYLAFELSKSKWMLGVMLPGLGEAEPLHGSQAAIWRR